MQRVIFCEPIKTGVKLPFWNAVIQMLYVLKLTHSLLMRPARCHLHTSVQLFYWMSPLDRTLPPMIAPVFTVLMFLYGDRWGGGGVTQWRHGSRRQEHHGGICIRRAAPCAVYPVARNKKVEGHSLPVGRKHFVTAQNNMPSERKKNHFDRCVIVVPPRAYFMLTRIALALKMYRVSCCRWQIHFTYRASLCHPSASFYVEAWRRPLRSHEVLLIQQIVSPWMTSTPGSKNVLMGERERRYYWRPT